MTNPGVGLVGSQVWRAAVGVGTAMFTGCAIASADSAGRDSSARRSAARRPARPGTPRPVVGAAPHRGPARLRRGRIGRHRHFSQGDCGAPPGRPRSWATLSDDGRRRARRRRRRTHRRSTRRDAAETGPPGGVVSFASAVTGVAQAGLRTAGIAGYLGPTQSTLNQTSTSAGTSWFRPPPIGSPRSTVSGRTGRAACP